MNYNEMNKNIGKNKGINILGVIFIGLGLLILIGFLSSYFNWKSKEKNYSLQYVYSDNGNLTYEQNGNEVNVDNIYDINGNIISLNVPDKKTTVMYCSIDKESECIYFDLNDLYQYSILHPFLIIIVELFIIGIGLFLGFNKRTKVDAEGNEKSSLSPIYMFCIFFFVLGLWTLYNQGTNIYKYLTLKNENNIATATIYSEIYRSNSSSEKYKPIAYYYVDGKRYLFINDGYIDGNLEDNIDKTFDLYFDSKNPSKSVKKDDFIDVFLLFFGILLVAFTFPFIFLKSKMEKRIDKNIENIENQEWKI